MSRKVRPRIYELYEWAIVPVHCPLEPTDLRLSCKETVFLISSVLLFPLFYLFFLFFFL